MAILEVVLTQTYAGQTTINRWNYVSVGTPASVKLSFALLSAFGGVPNPLEPGKFVDGSVMEQLRLLQSTGVDFSSLLVQDIYPNEDFFENTYTGISGARVGEALSPAVAYGFRSTRVDRSIGRGYKRFVGVAESDVGHAGMIDTAIVNGPMDTLKASMGNELTYDDNGNPITFIPSVCQKERYAIPDTNPTRYAYRYYSVLATQLEHTAQGVKWQPYDSVRTQVSRQYGRGR